MNLENRQIRISRLMAQAMPALTTAHVDVVEELSTDVRRTVASFELSFPEMWSNPGDPQLVSAVTEKLLSLPELG